MLVFGRAERLAPLLLAEACLGPGLGLAAWICSAALPEASNELIRLACLALPSIAALGWIIAELGFVFVDAASCADHGAGRL